MPSLHTLRMRKEVGHSPTRGATWRWNARGVWQWRLRFHAGDAVRDLAGVRTVRGLSWACLRVANDLLTWGVS